MTTLVGITGGIGSGKSTLTKELLKTGFKVHDSDKVVKNLYNKPTKTFLKHLEKIGLSKTLQKKRINKKLISKIIFSDKKIKKDLEEYIFSEVKKDRKKFIEKEKKKRKKIIFFDIPLLFENNLDSMFDKIITVVSTKKNRYLRLKKKKKITKNHFDKILKSQTTDKERKKRSDLVIINNLSKKNYIKKIQKHIKKTML